MIRRSDTALTMYSENHRTSNARAGISPAKRKGVSRMKFKLLKLEVRLWFLRLILIFK